MINRAQEIMKAQEAKMIEVERELQAQREGEAIKLVAEVREAVQILKCEYLLNGSEDDSRVKDLEAKLVVANNNIEALTKKCKEIEPLKSKATKAEKAKEDAIKAKKEAEKTISDLTKKLETITKTAATWQSKHDAVVKELAQKDKKIEALRQAVMCYETTKNKNVVVEEKPKTVKEEKIKVKEKTQEIASDSFELNTNVKFKSGTKVYESNDHYVLAKDSIKELVVVPKSFKVEVKPEDAVKYENLLVSKFNFKTDRQAISPVSVNFESDTHKAVLVRTRAAESLYQFSHKDILAGYIVSKYKVYFWSWDLKHNEPYFLDLGQKAKGRKRCEVSAGDRASLAKVVAAMREEYEVKVKEYSETHDMEFTSKEEAESKIEAVNSRLADILKYEEETQRIAESANKPETASIPEPTPETVIEINTTQDINSGDNTTSSNDASRLDESLFSNGMNDFFNEMF